ncbi:hypothetical protein GCM10011487_16400 [Steroidobacter agaridevorans]|uniref:Uncharacterized protein n=1 Tax=Steroidobacter agaridevorans TaxID=2695856 RepID=A0A829Y8Z2_9GAMM|nr:hypothetical protein [Steroidobacter agaridevorans]GFE79640.1 hypothetical protein GCM10011487_16400 [Steroidobacter agaridevorans]GFE88647.1 hypothetical protein GCM10011488_36010 [Steroidobacter agaridevorans]
MKKAALFVSGLLLTALASAPAVAEVVRVKVTARVVDVYDPGTMLHGKILAGSRLTGTYVYNTNTPNTSDDPEGYGRYVPYANEARMRFVSGGIVFENNQPTQGIEIEVDPQGEFGSGMFEMTSRDNKPLASTAQVDEITVRFNGRGNMTQSVALPAAVPTLTEYDPKEVVISSNFGQSFMVVANIESAEPVVVDAVVVSPAAGSFLSTQQFDAALALPRNSSVVSVIAEANGAPLPIGYPGSCTLVPPPTSAAQPAVLCPNADSLLPLAGGAPIEWTVELSNGSILTETSNWTFLH